MRLYLLTYEVVADYTAAAARLSRLPHRVMLRVPIQWNEEQGRMDDPGDYAAAFAALSEAADIMIEFVDSDAMKHLSPDSFEHHVRECLSVLGPHCKVGEAGNEVNGDWLGGHTAEKVRRAIAACTDHGLPAAVTYYLSADDPQQMFDWIGDNPLSSRYALISHYPNTTPGAQVDFKSVFEQFAGNFPADTILGWGEYGTEDADGRNTAPTSEREALIREVEQVSWRRIAPAIGNYAGLGGYWDWGTDTDLDRVFLDVWPARDAFS